MHILYIIITIVITMIYDDLQLYISIRMHSYSHLYHYMIRELRRVPSITPRQKKRSSSHSHLIWPLKNRLPRH